MRFSTTHVKLSSKAETLFSDFQKQCKSLLHFLQYQMYFLIFSLLMRCSSLLKRTCQNLLSVQERKEMTINCNLCKQLRTDCCHSTEAIYEIILHKTLNSFTRQTSKNDYFGNWDIALEELQFCMHLYNEIELFKTLICVY